MVQSLHPYNLFRRLWMPILLAVVTLAPLGAQQQSRHTIFKRTTKEVKGEQFRLFSTARAVPMTLDLAAFHSASSNNGELYLSSVPVAPDRAVDMDLKEFTNIAPDAKLTYTDDQGRHPLPAPTVKLYRGKIANEPKSDVYLAVCNTSVFGIIKSETSNSYVIATDFDQKKAGSNELCAVAYNTHDAQAMGGSCGTEDTPFSLTEMNALAKSQTDVALQADCPQALYAIKVAYDADYEFWQEWASDGGLEGATNFMVSLIAAGDVAFERDLQIQVTISFLNIWTTANDPYNESKNMPVALDEVGTFIRSAAMSNVDFGMAQVFSAKNWNGIIGIANGFNLICNKGQSYTIQLVKRYDPYGDAKVIAHEAGHVFGLRHTHWCGWNPFIDQCAAAESDNGVPCFSSVVQTQGTIMSYCANVDMVFHPKQIAFEKTLISTWPCELTAKKLETRTPLIIFRDAFTGTPEDTTVEDFFFNSTAGAVTIDSIKIPDDSTHQFSVINPATPIVVNSCASLPITLHYNASDTNKYVHATLVIYHDGLNVSWPGVPHINVDMEAYSNAHVPLFQFRQLKGVKEINFGKVKADQDSIMKIKGLYINLGTAPLHADSTVIIGHDAGDFHLVAGSAPFKIVPPTTSSDASIEFHPVTPGAKQAFLVVFSNSSGNPHDTIPLKGEVAKGPVLQLALPNFNVSFGEVVRGKTADTAFHNFFYNNGSDTLEYGADIQGPDKDLFPHIGNFYDLIGPGEGDSLYLAFHADPSAELGWKRAFLVINSNTPRMWDTIQMVAKIVEPSGVTGPLDHSAPDFSVSPNPVNTDAEIHVSPTIGEAGRDYTFRITDAAGHDVYRADGKFTPDGFTYFLRKGAVPAGAYYVTIKSARGTRVLNIAVLP